MRHTRYPPPCPAFRRVSDGSVFEGSPEPDGGMIADETEGSFHFVSEVIPLTATALIMYVLCGGTKENLASALSHKRGRKPNASLYEEAEIYTTRADVREEGY